LDYLANLINASFEDWRKQNLDKSLYDFDFSFSKMNSSLILVDIPKLNSVNSSIIKNMNLEVLYDKLTKYLSEFEKDFYENIFLKANKDYNLKIVKELQTKLIKFSEFKDLTTFFYNDFEVTSKIKDLLVNPKMKIENIEIAKK
jgi:glutamyl-tRNA synthetase/nondiscriminating glutamyl-tRNA synthetase